MLTKFQSFDRISEFQAHFRGSSKANFRESWQLTYFLKYCSFIRICSGRKYQTAGKLTLLKYYFTLSTISLSGNIATVSARCALGKGLQNASWWETTFNHTSIVQYSDRSNDITNQKSKTNQKTKTLGK